MEGVRKSVVTFNDATMGDEFLTAYISSGKEYTQKQVTDYLKDCLPSYMLPTYVVFLEEFPMTKNMKVDEKALPDPKRYQDQKTPEVIGIPSDPIDLKLMEICSEVLDTERVDMTESYLSLGGTSLGVMTLISRIYDEFTVEMSLEDILMSESLKDMAQIIRDKSAEDNDWDQSERKGFQYSKEEYLDSENFHENELGINVTGNKKIAGVVPFNEIFYRSCIYNAFIAAIKCWRNDELLFMSNDYVLYGEAGDNKIPGKVRYVEKDSLEELMEKAGIEMQLIQNSSDVTGDIVDVINKGGMVVLGVDCYFESIRKDFYLEKNWPHNILVYGYDGMTKDFIVLEQSGVNNLDYREQRLSFRDVEYAYHSNLQRFPNFEGGKNFVALYDKGEMKNSEASEYYHNYLNYLMVHIDDVVENLENVNKIAIYLRDHTRSLEVIDKEYSNLIMLLDSIIETKYAQTYIFDRFKDIEESWLQGSDVMNSISKEWKIIRNVIYKIKLTGVYQEDSIRTAIEGMDDIVNKEKSLYKWILNKFCQSDV